MLKVRIVDKIVVVAAYANQKSCFGVTGVLAGSKLKIQFQFTSGFITSVYSSFITLANIVYKLPEDGAEVTKHVAAFVI